MKSKVMKFVRRRRRGLSYYQMIKLSNFRVYHSQLSKNQRNILTRPKRNWKVYRSNFKLLIQKRMNKRIKNRAPKILTMNYAMTNHQMRINQKKRRLRNFLISVRSGNLKRRKIRKKRRQMQRRKKRKTPKLITRLKEKTRISYRKRKFQKKQQRRIRIKKLKWMVSTNRLKIRQIN